jgi:two-component system, NtrC family, nitrogen regulation sensor histidine kinase GlnL
MSLERFAALDLLATLVLVVQADDRVLFANASFEDVMGLSRRSLQGVDATELFVDAQAMRQAIAGARRHDFSALRFDDQLKRQGAEPYAVHVVVATTESADEVVVELLPQETQTRQDREERQMEQAQANKELIRNLAHEIKNPLGGIRGAAQLLQLELDSRDLTEYTQVIVREADRLANLGGPLARPASPPASGGQCEYPRGL